MQRESAKEQALGDLGTKSESRERDCGEPAVKISSVTISRKLD